MTANYKSKGTPLTELFHQSSSTVTGYPNMTTLYTHSSIDGNYFKY